MKKFLLLFLLCSCEGAQFHGIETTLDGSTLPEATTDAFEVDADAGPNQIPDVRADMLAPSDSGSVETSSDSGFDSGRDESKDAWAEDIVLEPWCPDSEIFPVFSTTCYNWGIEHGWTLQGCCLPDHTCGTVQGSPRECRK